MTRFSISSGGLVHSCAFMSGIALALAPTVGPGALAAQAAPRSSNHCFMGSRLLRSLVGGGLGGWVGFVGIEIKLNDWNDANRSSAANRQRVRATLAGAALGATVGALLPKRCGNAAVPSPDAVGSSFDQPISADEITHAGISGTAYDIVYALRRRWLNDRGVDSPTEAPRVATTATGQEVVIPGEVHLIIYLDNMRMGTVSELRNIPAAGILGIRYYTPVQANYRWGRGHSHGAIQVLTVTEQSSR